MAYYYACNSCGKKAHTEPSIFDQNIGALRLRFHKTYEGMFCRSCTTKYFLQATLITLCIGWCGVISLVLAPFYVIRNCVRYVQALIAFADEGKQRDTAATNRLIQHSELIQTRLAEGKSIAVIAREVATQSGVSVEQASQYVVTVMRSSQTAPMGTKTH